MTGIIHIRFYEELNDFLPKALRKKVIEPEYNGRQSVKDLIEANGVPHTEVGLIIVNGESVTFDYIIEADDYISVYPVFELIDISPINKLRPEPLCNPNFAVDVNLGKLAKNLRLLGFDTFYDNNIADVELVEISINEKRIILTRDVGVLKRSAVTHGYWVRNTGPEEQTIEVIEKFSLESLALPLKGRCMKCNGLLKEVGKEKILEQLQPKTIEFFDTFYQCGNCRSVYWKGGHMHRILKKVNMLLKR